MELIEKYEAKKQKTEHDIIERQKQIDNLKDQLAALENDIFAAIDADSLDDVERLTRSKYDLQLRIDSAEMINKRKTESGGVSPEEAQAAWDEDLEKRQKAISAKSDRANKLLQDAVRAAADLAQEVTTAESIRARYARLIGEELSFGHGAGFTQVKSPLKLMEIFKAVCEDCETGINPEDREKITKAANPYCYSPI